MATNEQDFDIKEFSTPEGAVDYHKVNKYTFLYDAFYGCGGFYGDASIGSYVIHSRSEPHTKYSERVQRGYYPNMFEPFITAQYRPVSSEQPPTTVILDSSDNPLTTDIGYNDFIADINGAGLNKDRFYQNLARSSYSDAVTYVVMDKMKGDVEPFCYQQDAITVEKESIETDRKGNLTQIAFIVEDGFDTDSKQIYKRTTWTNDSVKEETTTDTGSDRKWTLVSEQPLQIDYMPVYPVFSQQRSDTKEYLPFPASSFKIAGINTALYNSAVEYIWHVYSQALGRMWTTADIESIKDANSSAIKLDGDLQGGTPAIGYVSADTGIAKSHLDAISFHINMLINLMAEQGVIVTRMESNNEESGRSKAFTYRAQNSKLNSTVNNMYVPLDKWMQETYKQYNDPTGTWSAVTTYKTDYAIQDPITITDLRDVIDVMKEFKLIEPLKGAIKNAVRKVANNDSEYAIMEEEIDALIDLPETTIE